MYITRLKIENFQGIEALEVEPGKLTILKGRNGAGKTSVLEAVRAAITNRGERSRFVRDGEDRGLILFELSEGISGRRRVSDGGRTAGRSNIAQSELDKLMSGYGFNPVSFLDLSDAEQREEILRVTRIELSMDEAQRLSGGHLLDGVDYTEHPLTVLKQIEETLYQERRDVNRDAKEKRSTAQTMRDSVDRAIDVDAVQNFDLEAAIATLTRAEDRQKALVAKERRVAQIQAQMEALQRELEKLTSDLEELRADTVDTGSLRADVEAYKRDRDAWRTLQDAKQIDQQASELESTSDSFTALIEEVRGKPAELLQSAELPVDGLGIDADGNVTVRGLPISELSTGEQLLLATDIALATLPEDGLRVVLVDGLEKLDPENRERMLGKLAQTDVQVLATEVSDTELTVITDFQTLEGDDIPF